MKMHLLVGAAVGLLLAATPVAVADDVTSSSPDFVFSTPTKVLTLDVGQTKTVTFQLVGTGGDAKPGCNLTGNGKKVTLGVTTSAVPATALAGLSTPTSIEIPDCDPATVTASITGATAGSADLSFPVMSVTTSRDGVDASDFDTSAASFRVNVVAADSTPPQITHTLTPAEPASGWYAGPVAVDWTVTDAQSAITSLTGCQDELWSTETTVAGHTFSCTATSAGGTAGPENVTVRLDLTAPVVTPTVTGVVGSDGWYTSDTTIAWATSDALSGLTPGSACPEVRIDTDQAATPYTCTVADLAGNTTTSTVTVKRDASAPVITKTVSGTQGNDGWYTSDVDVDWTVTEATSAPVTLVGCVDETVTDTAGSTSGCSATNAAGLSASDSVSVKVDTTAPRVQGAATGTMGDNGWFVGDVAVDWTYDEDGSGIMAPCATGSRTTDTTGTDFTCQVTDRAGNSSTVATVTVKRDATPPTITSSVDGTEGTNGWYTSDVDVDFEVSDATSGLSTTAGCDPAPLTTDSAGTGYLCQATDLAGNAASKEVTVKRDATVPVISWLTGPADGATYDFGDPVPAATCSATDATSGVSAAGCSVSGGGATVGTHTLTATAADNAGNSATDQRSYAVRAWTLQGFHRPVDSAGVINTVKAGATVPLKFNVLKGGTPLTADIGAVFSVRRITCETGAEDVLEEFATTGSTQLRYDAAGGQWVQNWATPSGGMGNCYRVTMATADGSSISASFKLK